MSKATMTEGRCFQPIKTMSLQDWLRTLKDDQTIRVIRGENGWLWLQCNDSKEVFITEVWETEK